MGFHRRAFTVSITCVARFMVVRDRVLGLCGWAPRGDFSGQPASRHSIESAGSLLDAVFVEPAAGPPQAALLICHGIGETVGGWLPVQQLLAAGGVASLVFDYSGYGRSTGTADWERFEQDALDAFARLEQLAPGVPCSIFGFSLGSGIAAAVASRVNATNLILGEAFTSFRDAAGCAGIPAALAGLVPPIWNAGEALRNCQARILIVHGEKDGLFPVKMACDLAALCPATTELAVIPNVGHNQPFRRPNMDYWGPVIARLTA